MTDRDGMKGGNRADDDLARLVDLIGSEMELRERVASGGQGRGAAGLPGPATR